MNKYIFFYEKKTPLNKK